MFEFDQNINLLPLNFHYSILLSIHDFFSLIERIIVYERRARKKEDFFGTFLKQNDLINKGQEGGLCNHF